MGARHSSKKQGIATRCRDPPIIEPKLVSLEAIETKLLSSFHRAIRKTHAQVVRASVVRHNTTLLCHALAQRVTR